MIKLWQVGKCLNMIEKHLKLIIIFTYRAIVLKCMLLRKYIYVTMLGSPNVMAKTTEIRLTYIKYENLDVLFLRKFSFQLTICKFVHGEDIEFPVAKCRQQTLQQKRQNKY